MAIDNAEERRAAAAVPIGPGVTPNVDKDAEWRAQSAGSFMAADEADGGAAVLSPVQPAARSTVHSPAFSPLSVHPALIGGA